MHLRRIFILHCVLFVAANPVPGRADAVRPSPMLTGPAGLNTVPSARMEESGTVSAGLAAMDPYVHGFFGFQIAEPLYIGLRQTAEASGILDDPDRLYPGADFKLRLLKEGPHNPAIAIGAQSAFGHKRMAGEYLAFSKRVRDFDFTAGIGWGRLGSAGHLNNPLKILHSHFGRNRALDGEMPNDFNDWFTGETAGFFAGLEYRTPVDGLSVKADIGADRFAAERTATGYEAPAPWSVGLSYSPWSWINAGLAMQGDDKIMARLTLRGDPRAWPLSPAAEKETVPLRPYRTGLALPDRMRLSAEREGMILHGVQTDLHTAAARLDLSPYRSTPAQLGEAVRHMANHAGPALETFVLEPRLYGLRGPRIALLRTDFENALAFNRGSADEIWTNARFLSDKETRSLIETADTQAVNTRFKPRGFRLALDSQASLSEEDNGALYRSSLLAEFLGPNLFEFLHAGMAWRLNLKDNLKKIDEIRPRPALPVRSDVADFADNRILLDRLYQAVAFSVTPDLHMLGAAGYLEEMYAGAGGEILYRPYGKRYAVGTESWLAFKRDPFAPLAAGLNGDHLLTGHVQGWYEFPDSSLTLHAKAGRYLAEDLGVTLALARTFKNSARLEGFVTLSGTADADLLGGVTHAHHGIRLTLPLGGLKPLPEGTEARFAAAPFGRDIGQILDAPLKLYELTEPLSARHMINHWREITD